MSEDVRNIDSSDTGSEIVEIRLEWLISGIKGAPVALARTLLPVIKNGQANVDTEMLTLAINGSTTTVSVPTVARGVYFRILPDYDTDTDVTVYFSTNSSSGWLTMATNAFGLLTFQKGSLPSSLYFKQAVTTADQAQLVLIWI